MESTEKYDIANKEMFIGDKALISEDIEKIEVNGVVNVSEQIEKESQFETIVDCTLRDIRELLLIKGKEYRRNNDPFHNFNVGSEITGQIREKVLDGFRLKHLISSKDILNDLEKGIIPSRELVEEKYNDILLYYILEKASIIDRILSEKIQ